MENPLKARPRLCYRSGTMGTGAKEDAAAVLVVDDERFWREVCTELISGQGFRVLTAPDAAEGLRLARQQPVGVILLDLILPGASGLEALQVLSAELPDIPVIIMTAHSSESRVRDSLKLGAYDFLLKPLQSDDLLHSIRRAMERHRLFSENRGLLRELQEQVQSQSAEMTRDRQLTDKIISHMASGLLLTDQAGRVRRLNQQGEKTLGITEAQAAGQHLAVLFPGAEALLDVRAGIVARELDLERPDGQTVPLGFNNTLLLDSQGRPEGTIVIFRDLSDVRALQAEVRRKERLAAIGEVASGVAHEIRNPLFGISSVAQILLTEVHFDPVHQELLAAMQAEIARLNTLVEGLLDYGRPSKLQRTPQALDQIWDEILGLAREELATSRLSVARDVEGNLPLVPADGNKLRQVFLNLLKNAIQATPPGGHLTIRLRLARRHELPAPIQHGLALRGGDGHDLREYVTCALSDTGVGISEANLEKVFDLFFTTKSSGSGLGLAICRRIVEDHGGAIAIQSRELEGSTVIVALPVQPGP
jgi:PAS domain S-box-containing protein